MLAHLRPVAILAVLWLIQFYPLVISPSGTLYTDTSDFLGEHLPAKIFLNRECRGEGEFPLWNPYHFCGTPFVHDIQGGWFYPPYAVMYLIPEGDLGWALSWVICLHVQAAGFFTFTYARHRGIGELGSLVAASGFMLSAKWQAILILAGQTITVGIAWLPLVLLGVERAITTGSLKPAIAAGTAYGMMILGTHPQWTFYSTAFIALWTLGLALMGSGYFGGTTNRTTGRALALWLRALSIMAAVGISIACVQLLPTAEAGRWSSRAVGMPETGSLALGLRTAFALVGPWPGAVDCNSWEMQGLLALFWLAAALAAPAMLKGRAVWEGAVILIMLFFSVGGAVAFEWLPGFNLFRIPGRMLLVATFPIAFLAGSSTDALIKSRWDEVSRRALIRSIGFVAVVAALPSLVRAGYLFLSEPNMVINNLFVAYWLTVPSLAVALLAMGPRAASRVGTTTTFWLIVLGVDLLMPIIGVVEVKPQRELYPRSEAVDYLLAHRVPGETRILDRDSGWPDHAVSALGIGSPLAMIDQLESVRGYNPLDVNHYRQYIGMVAGSAHYAEPGGPLTIQVIPNFDPVQMNLFSVLGVRYWVVPSDQAVDDKLWTRVLSETHPAAGLPLQSVYRYKYAWPRAFVIPNAARMPKGEEESALQKCDFRRVVLLAGDDPLPPNAPGFTGTARIVVYKPNRVEVRVDGGSGGLLVLIDTWYPGWRCRVNGMDVPVERADHAFRAVSLPSGQVEAIFTFEPGSLRAGAWISAVAVALLGLYGTVLLARKTMV